MDALKLKNIVKTMEGRSKSHFSHIRNKVKQRPQDLSFWRGFWIPTLEHQFSTSKGIFFSCFFEGAFKTYFLSILARSLAQIGNQMTPKIYLKIN